MRQNFDFDLIIKNAKIIDGTGNPWYYADIGICGDTIVKIGDLQKNTSHRAINAGRRIVCPGFIDVHTHCDRGLGKNETTANINYLSQGVTTVVAGNCGSGAFRIRKTRKQWKKTGIGTNVVMQVGYGTIRAEVMGLLTRTPTKKEAARMKAILEQAMKEGAWGLSAAFQYIPDRYAATEEVMELVNVVAESGGVFSCHLRSEGAELIEAVNEAIRIGEQTGVKINISHLKVSGKDNWGSLKIAAALISAARERGIRISADLFTYPQCVYSPLVMIFNIPDNMPPLENVERIIDYHYVAKRVGISVDDYFKSGSEKPILSSSPLDQYCEALRNALKDYSKRKRIQELTQEGAPDKLNWVPMFGWSSFTIVESKNPELQGRTIADIAREYEKTPFDLAVEMLNDEKNDLIISVFTMSEEEIASVIKNDYMMVGSDGGAAAFRPGTKGHPGLFGTFPRVLRKFVREEKLLTLEDAVRMITSLPAQFLGLRDRGLIREGYKADLVVFDPNEVQDNSTYSNSHQLSTGFEYIILNGRICLERGSYNNTLNGRVLLQTSNGSLNRKNAENRSRKKFFQGEMIK
ncbi:MAG: D-aminoacylase [Candidatus Aminicenantes bacterium]|nr:D-aminoacylase [Candidatus Aminicenantes bacterium]